MKYIIDPPSDFAPVAEWRAHLKDLRRLRRSDPSDPDLRAAEKEAEAALRRAES